ncbi:MAG: putative Ig domain-containing protein [Gemmataceae bacterium]
MLLFLWLARLRVRRFGKLLRWSHQRNRSPARWRFYRRPQLEQLEDRIAPTGNITLTNVSVVDASDNPLSVANVGQQVYIQADFTTRNLRSNASYRIAYTVNGLTLETPYLNYGAGDSSGTWYEYWGTFIAMPGSNQVSVTVDPDQSVPETTYADNTMTSTFNAVTPAVGNPSYTVAQIRDAYGINSLTNFGAAAADGTGQTIAIVDAYNDPTILQDLDGFDQAMSLTLNSTENLYQQYGPASSILSVYNQDGTNITSNIANSGSDGVPNVDPTGSWEGEETMDVEWAHAIAPGAKIDLIETDGQGSFEDLFTGAATAAQLPGVTAVSMSWIWFEGDWSSSGGSGELAYDSSTFVTPPGHPGITFLASSGDGGQPGGYPAFSPNVVAVGGTQLTINNNAYSSETAWSFPTPRTLDFGSSSFNYESGTWNSQTGGFTGSYATANGGSNSSASWTTSISSSDQGWVGGTEVSATWTANANNATNATYLIYDGTGTSGPLLGTVTVDQTQAPVGTSDEGTLFQELGDFYPTSGSLTVVLSANSANGTVVADTVGIAPAWATAGGQSQYESEPSYQLSVQNTGKRTTPDVSFDGSDSSGVTCFQNGGLGYDYFGTSLSSPCWAGLIAIANQGRVANGGTVFNSTANPMQILQALYNLPDSDFNDITAGYNGFTAGPGYDELTGRGSPIANLLIPDLVDSGNAPTVTSISPNNGSPAGGTSATITGTGFTEGSTVSFGTLAATSVTVNSSTSITAAAPPESAGSVDVTVTTPYGTSAIRSADQFTYGAPVITTQPTDQTVMAGYTATFTVAANSDPTPTAQWQVSTDGGHTFSNLSDGENVSGSNTDTLTLGNLTFAMNGYEYQAVFTNSISNATTRAATLTVPPISFSPATLLDASVGTAYKQIITAMSIDGTPTVSVQITPHTLPKGMMIKAKGDLVTISGTPKTSGSVTFLVTGKDKAGDNYSLSYTLNINPAPPITLSLSTSDGSPYPLPAATLGTAYSQTITVSGGGGKLTLTHKGSLPKGMKITFKNNVVTISGKPTTSGSFTFSVTAKDKYDDTITQSYTLTVSASGDTALTDAAL